MLVLFSPEFGSLKDVETLEVVSLIHLLCLNIIDIRLRYIKVALILGLMTLRKCNLKLESNSGNSGKSNSSLLILVYDSLFLSFSCQLPILPIFVCDSVTFIGT